jgi:type VI secretion system secreted protein Hcp
MTTPIKLAITASLVALGVMTAAPARAECFLKLDGVKGESTDAKHSGEIEVLAWSWGLTQSASTHVSAGAGTGSADFGDIKISKALDHATPILTQFAAKGTAVNNATLSCRQSAKSNGDYLTISLTLVLVSSLKVAIDKDRPTEEISLNFNQIKMTHRQPKSDGSLGEAVTFTFNIAKKQ